MEGRKGILCTVILFCLLNMACSITFRNDAKVLDDFRKGLQNPDLLDWPDNGNDPCGPPSWPHVFCSDDGRVTQIQVADLGLKGTLPQKFNQLTELNNLGLQNNNFSGKVPTFSGLSELEFAYLDFNDFNTIPVDFFNGLTKVQVLALDDNPFNGTAGWSIPDELQDSVLLTNFSCSRCNIVGPLPDFFGKLSSLTSLRLSYNRLSGELPTSFQGSMLQILWLNGQYRNGMTGSIDVISSMVALTQVWLHGNSFTGSIPENIGALTSLRELKVNDNQLVGPIPPSLSTLDLQLLDLENNMLMGPIPKFEASDVSFSSNSFCQSTPGLQCAAEVNSLLDFLHALNYPVDLASRWSGNDPCEGPWLGLSCNQEGEVSVINLEKQGLTGTLSPSLANLHSLIEIHLGENNISGGVPTNLVELESLRLLDITGNNFQPPLPEFSDDVQVSFDHNPLFANDSPSSLSKSPSDNGQLFSSKGSRSSPHSSTVVVLVLVILAL